MSDRPLVFLWTLFPGPLALTLAALAKLYRQLQLECGRRSLVFAAKTKNDIVPDSVSPAGSTWQNADTHRKGFELSAFTLLSKTTAIRLAYTAIDAEYTSNGSASSTRVQDGKDMPGIPRYRVFGDVTWRSVGWLTRSNNTHSEAGVELVAIGDTWANSQNTAKANNYELFNLKVSHHIKMGATNLSFIARLDNVTDQKYVGSVVVDQSSNRFYEPGAPRNWLLGLKYTVQM
jgi:iron complex outermembrane recepter protein